MIFDEFNRCRVTSEAISAQHGVDAPTSLVTVVGTVVLATSLGMVV